ITEGGDRLTDGAAVQLASDIHARGQNGAAATPGAPSAVPTAAPAAAPTDGKPRKKHGPSKPAATTG
ncbi:MAG TPA: hypothetical protein VII70_10495, partial [Steroidobacteraceae bacterium]